jgi:hypothetical protein
MSDMNMDYGLNMNLRAWAVKGARSAIATNRPLTGKSVQSRVAQSVLNDL